MPGTDAGSRHVFTLKICFRNEWGPNWYYTLILTASLAVKSENACSMKQNEYFRQVLTAVTGFNPWVGKIPWKGKGYPLQYSGLENSMDRIVHGVAKSQTQLSNFHLSSLDCCFNLRPYKQLFRKSLSSGLSLVYWTKLYPHWIIFYLNLDICILSCDCYGDWACKFTSLLESTCLALIIFIHSTKILLPFIGNSSR